MRILLVITDYGSFNNFLSELAVGLVDQQHEVHVLCSKQKVINLDDKYPYEDLGIKFHFLDFPRSFNLVAQLKASKKIYKEILSIKPDLVNIHFTTGIFTTVLWKKLPFFTVGTIHGIGYTTMKGICKKALFEKVEKFCFNRLDQICVLNQSDYELVKSLHPEKAYKYNSYGVGCDLKKFDPDTLSDSVKTSVREKLNIHDNDFVIAFTGRFVAFKGFDTVVRSMISLIKETQNYQNIKLLLIGGKDPAHHTGLTTIEEEFCEKNEQIIRVDYTADVNHYLSVTDLFVFPSEKEGMPVCIMEALAMGVPVITANSRGCNDLVKDQFNGLLLSEKPSVQETREAILKLYHDRNLLRQIAENAYSQREELNREVYVKDQLEAYTDAIYSEANSTVVSMLKERYNEETYWRKGA